LIFIPCKVNHFLSKKKKEKKKSITLYNSKLSVRTRSGSMALFTKKYHSRLAIRISQKNFGFENGIKSIPFYAAHCI